jgi:hypothetical protein
VKCYNQGSGKSRVRSRACGTRSATACRPPSAWGHGVACPATAGQSRKGRRHREMLRQRQVASTWIRESPDSGFGRERSGKVPSKDAFMSSIRPLSSAPCNLLTRTPKMKEMSWRKVLADRSCGDPRAYRLIQARSDKTSLRSADYVKSLCSTSEFGFNSVTLLTFSGLTIRVNHLDLLPPLYRIIRVKSAVPWTRGIPLQLDPPTGFPEGG